MKPGVMLYDASVGGRLILRGEDRRSFLHNFCTNDVESLVDDGACEAFVTDMRGHVVSHVWISAQSEELWLHAVGASLETLRSHLEKYVITEDVVIEDRTMSTSRALVCGVDCEAAADAIVAISPDRIHRATVGWVGDRDVLLWVEGEEDQELPLAAVAVGVPVGSPESFDARRIAALLPIVGQDIGPENLAQEVDRDSLAISFAKGCYLGQETIARVQSRGRVNRLLRGLECDGGWWPETGAVIRGEQETEVGRIGSVAPRDASEGGPAGSAIALAVVRREVAEPGTQVWVETASGTRPARIVGPVV